MESSTHNVESPKIIQLAGVPRSPNSICVMLQLQDQTLRYGVRLSPQVACNAEINWGENLSLWDAMYIEAKHRVAESFGVELRTREYNELLEKENYLALYEAMWGEKAPIEDFKFLTLLASLGLSFYPAGARQDDVNSAEFARLLSRTRLECRVIGYRASRSGEGSWKFTHIMDPDRENIEMHLHKIMTSIHAINQARNKDVHGAANVERQLLKLKEEDYCALRAFNAEAIAVLGHNFKLSPLLFNDERSLRRPKDPTESLVASPAVGLDTAILDTLFGTSKPALKEHLGLHVHATHSLSITRCFETFTVGKLTNLVFRGGPELRLLSEEIRDAGVARWGPELKDIFEALEREPPSNDYAALQAQNESFCQKVDLRVGVLKQLLSVYCEQAAARECKRFLHGSELTVNIYP